MNEARSISVSYRNFSPFSAFVEALKQPKHHHATPEPPGPDRRAAVCRQAGSEQTGLCYREGKNPARRAARNEKKEGGTTGSKPQAEEPVCVCVERAGLVTRRV